MVATGTVGLCKCVCLRACVFGTASKEHYRRGALTAEAATMFSHWCATFQPHSVAFAETREGGFGARQMDATGEPAAGIGLV